ncbi:MAG: entericidin A/B family lipoprotein [Pseudomonadota bacterium]
MRLLKSIAAGCVALPLLAGCNTIQGVGEDVQAVGSGVTSAARYVEREMFGARPLQTASVQPASAQRGTPQVRVGRACDPGSDLAGGSGLPPCRSQIVRPTQRPY